MESDAKFCTSCGTAVESAAEPMAETTTESSAEPTPPPAYDQPTYEQPAYGQPAHEQPTYGQPPYPVYGQQYPPAYSPAEKKGGNWWKIALVIAIPVVLIAALIVGIFALVNNRSSETSLQRAMDNPEVEMMEHIDSTPIEPVPVEPAPAPEEPAPEPEPPPEPAPIEPAPVEPDPLPPADDEIDIDENLLVGTWFFQDNPVWVTTFYQDGSGTHALDWGYGTSFRWSTSDTNIFWYYPGFPRMHTPYRISDDVLYITMDDGTVYRYIRD